MKGVKDIQKQTKIITNDKKYNQSWAELYKTLQELLDRRQALLKQVEEFKVLDNALKNYFSGGEIPVDDIVTRQ